MKKGRQANFSSLNNQNEDTATKTTCIFKGTGHSGAMLPQCDKLLHHLVMQQTTIDWACAEDGYTRKDDSGTGLTKIVSLGGGWNSVTFVSNSILGIISTELIGYAPILLCTQVHASHMTA